MTTYTVGSLFTGIGGIDLAFERAGFVISWQVEIDDYCNQVLAKHWPGVFRFRDVRTVGAADLAAVDVLVGGFPCTDISLAGKGAGIKVGTRSGLWFEFARLIGELRPRYVFLENVAAITSRDGTIVISDLATLGYDCQWGIVAAADAGAPHRRERWFCVARRGVILDDSAYRYHEPTTRQSANCWQPDGSRIGTGFQPRFSNAGQTVGNADWRRCEQRDTANGRLPIIDARCAGVGQADASSANGKTCNGDGMGVNSSEMELSPACSRGQLVISNSERQQEQRGDFAAKSPVCCLECAGCLGNANRNIIGTFRTLSGWQDCQPEGSSWWSIESRLGRVFDGLPRRLDAARRTSRWPARPGEAQHDWEAPRVATGVRNRVARLKALGNSVVPQVVQPFAEGIREALEDEDSAGDVTRRR